MVEIITFLFNHHTKLYYKKIRRHLVKKLQFNNTEQQFVNIVELEKY